MKYDTHDPLKGRDIDVGDPKYKNIKTRLRFSGYSNEEFNNMWLKGMLVHKRKPQSYTIDLVSIAMIHSYMRTLGRKNQSVFVNELIMRGLISLSLDIEGGE